MATDLWNSGDPATWQSLIDAYWDIIATSGKEHLLELERWYQESFSDAISVDRQMSKDQLVRLVDWKLRRGKWRPRLLDYAKAAADEAVSDSSLRCFAILANRQQASNECTADTLKASMAAIMELKGVGAATASAIISAADASVPFMSDDALSTCLGSRDYTVTAAVRLMEAVQKKARALSRHGDAERKWTSRDVERCLFAAALKDKLKIGVQKKRKR